MMFKLFLLLPIILDPKCLVYSNDDSDTSTTPVDTKGLKLFTKDENGVTMDLDQKLYDVKPLNINNNIIVFKLKDNAKCMIIKLDNNVIWSRDNAETPTLLDVKQYPKQVSFHTKPNIVFIVFENEYLGYMLLGNEWKHLLRKENKKPEERRPSLPPKEPEQQQEPVEQQPTESAESSPAGDDADHAPSTDDDNPEDQDASKPAEAEDTGMVASSSGNEDQKANEESEEANEEDQASGESGEGTTAEASEHEEGEGGTNKEEDENEDAEESATDPNEGEGGTTKEEDENEEAEEPEESTKTGTDGDQDPSGGSAEADGTKTSGETSEGADGGSTFATTPEANDQDSSSGTPLTGGTDQSTTPETKQPDGGSSTAPGSGLTSSPTTDASSHSVKLTGVELSLKAKKGTNEFSYVKKGKVVTYEAKSGYGFSSVKTKKGGCNCCGSTCNASDHTIWDAANESEYATKVVLDGKGKKDKSVTIHLAKGTKKEFKKQNKKWTEVSQNLQDPEATSAGP